MSKPMILESRHMIYIKVVVIIIQAKNTRGFRTEKIMFPIYR